MPTGTLLIDLLLDSELRRDTDGIRVIPGLPQALYD